MVDTLSPEQRRLCMSRISGKNTKPELVIRKALFRQGFRYKLHDKNLHGKPDLVFPEYNAVIFIHGCFWHGHNCNLFNWPETNTTFWREKITGNRMIDLKNYKHLKKDGWYILTIWGCALKGKKKKPLDKIVESVESWLLYETRNKTIRG